MVKLLEKIFCACDNARRADETEERLLDELEAEREELKKFLTPEAWNRLERYFSSEQAAESYVERAYFCDGFRAAMQLLKECDIVIKGCP